MRAANRLRGCPIVDGPWGFDEDCKRRGDGDGSDNGDADGAGVDLTVVLSCPTSKP